MNTPPSDLPDLEMSPKLEFFLQHFKNIIELEKNLRFSLSESAMSKN